MKKQLAILALLVITCFAMPARAQEINISFQPTWGPVGYNYVNYYYIPDIEAYYSVPTGQFTYFNGAEWINSPYLPPQYAGFDLYHSYKVVLNEPNPWFHHDLYRGRYYEFRGRYNQGLIRESHDHRYTMYRDARERREREYHEREHRFREEHHEEHRGGEAHREGERREEHREGERREEHREGEHREGEHREGEAHREGERHEESGREAARGGDHREESGREAARGGESGRGGSGRPTPSAAHGSESGHSAATRGGGSTGGTAFGSKGAVGGSSSRAMSPAAKSSGASMPAAKSATPAKSAGSSTGGSAKHGKK